MKIRMKQDFDGAKAGDELQVDSTRGIYLQGMGAADIVEHDEPKARAKTSKLADTPQSKAVAATLKPREE